MIENGCTPYEIIKEHPSTYTQIPNIERAIALYNAEKVKNIFRKLEVVYIWGQTGVGKTRYVLEKYGYTNVTDKSISFTPKGFLVSNSIISELI